MATRGGFVKLLTFLAVVGISLLARAGGFEYPTNSTEPLGRGGAFTAKADNASAMEYNVAGLARQRGTRMLIEGNLSFQGLSFQRAGAYDDGTPYPKVSNQGGPQIGPFIGVSTDFGKLDRWTFAFGLYGPSAYGVADWGDTVNGRPNPARYDFTRANIIIVYPTLAAAVRATRWLDLGVALHLVGSSFDLTNTVTAYGYPVLTKDRTTPGGCTGFDDAGCDSKVTLNTTGFTATGALGAMFRPKPYLSIGLNVRGPIAFNTSGTATITRPQNLSAIGAGFFTDPTITTKAQFNTHLPWVVRLGIRYLFLRNGVERGDIELNGVYEAWGAAENPGSYVTLTDVPAIRDASSTVVHNYRDTWGARLGGAYNLDLPVGLLTLRGGFAFDSAATRAPDTRIDFNTLNKYIPTIGVGYRIRGVTINAAYAALISADRTVRNGRLQATSISGRTTDDFGNEQTPVINNGTYSAITHIVSLGVNVEWDEALKKKRVIHYQ